MSGRVIRRGAVYWVSFELGQGGEVKKRRPSVIVSNDAANRHLNRVQVVPRTSNTNRLFPGGALVSVGGRFSKALADQIATATKGRIGDLLGFLSDADMRKVEAAIRRQLGLV